MGGSPIITYHDWLRLLCDCGGDCHFDFIAVALTDYDFCHLLLLFEKREAYQAFLLRRRLPFFHIPADFYFLFLPRFFLLFLLLLLRSFLFSSSFCSVKIIFVFVQRQWHQHTTHTRNCKTYLIESRYVPVESAWIQTPFGLLLSNPLVRLDTFVGECHPLVKWGNIHTVPFICGMVS